MKRSPGSVDCRRVDCQLSPVVDNAEQVIAVPLGAELLWVISGLTSVVHEPVVA
jgi:hypothetical protein